ncbi:hypothetical protein WN944_021930 [Citrus x changshan-huyou]|uniref:Transmembrane protein n=1 Tax=Citrus x changshan-huyou TaxID=2935761 RepID=A0AAP0R0V3_9ROSI
MARLISSKSVLLTLFVFAIVSSPMLPCEAAAKSAANDLGAVMRAKKLPPFPPKVYCLHCVCCAPAPPGECCKCDC